jgi:colanic acid/amylovoran biosynthesis protein
MNIEVRGVNFVNKGAELMLHAVIEELSRSCPHALVAMDLKAGSYRNRARLGLYQKPMRSEWMFGSGIIKFFSRKKTRERYGVLLASQIDAVLDASGFAYSDQFGTVQAEKLARKVKKWKRSGKKIVLLPQAFGPFETQPIRKAFQTIVDNVDLLFPRDHDSYDHVVGLVGERDYIRLRPDFTNLVKGKVPEYFEVGRQRACLIPNSKMIEKTSEVVRDAYIPFLAECGRFLKHAGLDPFLLVHEAKKDGNLAREVRNRCDIPLDIVEEMDPVYIKGIIGCSSLVVGSRYHGLVSALSQGVPAIATGWSHKYQRLYEEYGCSEFLIEDLDFELQAMPRIKRLINEDSRGEIVDNLLKSSASQVQKTKLMWQEVMELIYPENQNDLS